MNTGDTPDVAVEDLGRIAAKRSRTVHRDGTRLRHEVEGFLAGMSRQISVDQVLHYRRKQVAGQPR